MTRLGFLAAAALGLMAATGAGAQEYPSKTVQIIVPFPPGGIIDAAARQVQPELERALKRSVVIDNRAGAGGAVGTAAVVRSEPDGHTLLMVASSHATAPAVNPNLSYDTDKDLAPVITVARDPMLFVIGNKVPAKTLQEFVALAKSKPGALNYSSPGFGSQTQFVTELFGTVAGMKLQHVPYRGGAPALQAVVQGDVEFTVLSGQVTLPQIEAGTLRAIAVGGPTRHPRAPDVPTIGETGYPTVEAMQWVGLFAPAKTPRAIIDRLNAALNEALADKAVAARITAAGLSPAGGAPEDLGRVVTAEIKLWKDTAKAANMKLAD
ncbi:MAG: hypothetical protein JWN93_4011 [Hyphomicrobiales bacterium]|nr:hypothetical protein [Hyphomicrobiales bacterium]